MDLFSYVIGFIAIVFLLLASLFIGLSFNRNRIISEIQQLTEDNQRIKKDLRVISSGSISVGQRLVILEEYIQQIALKQDKSDSRQKDLSSYSHAAKIIEIGGNIDDVMQSCGLSKAEAELVAKLKNRTDSQ